MDVTKWPISPCQGNANFYGFFFFIFFFLTHFDDRVHCVCRLEWAKTEYIYQYLVSLSFFFFFIWLEFIFFLFQRLLPSCFLVVAYNFYSAFFSLLSRSDCFEYMNNALNGARSGILVLFIYIFFYLSLFVSFFLSLYICLTRHYLSRSLYTFVTHFIYLWYACAIRIWTLRSYFQLFSSLTHHFKSGVVDTRTSKCAQTHCVYIFLWMGKMDMPFFTWFPFKTLIHFAKSFIRYVLFYSVWILFFYFFSLSSEVISLIELCIVSMEWFNMMEFGISAVLQRKYDGQHSNGDVSFFFMR